MSDSDFPWNTTHRSQPNPPKRNPLDGYEKEPKLYTINGKETPLYGLGALAHALDRQANTMRKWEERGYLPSPPVLYEGDEPKDELSFKHGQRRLYPLEIILAVYEIAREEGVLEHNSRPIKDTRFIQRVKALFQEYKDRTRPNVVARSYTRYEGHRKERA